jgi:hypothetical protein
MVNVQLSQMLGVNSLVDFQHNLADVLAAFHEVMSGSSIFKVKSPK